MLIENLYWLAGIIDGEGFFTTNKRQGIHRKANNGDGQYSYITRIGIGNTDMEMIKKVSEIYCELGIKFWYCLHSPHRKFPNAKKYVSINVEGYKSTKKLIDAVIDKLASTQKKMQAKLMSDYVNYRLSILNNRLDKEIQKDNFEKIDVKFAEELKSLKNYQISPSTTKRVASTPLSW